MCGSLLRQWAALIGLRLVVVLLTLFALLRPTFVYTKVEPVQASLVLLVDGSRSMQVADSLGDKSRWDAMKLLLDAAAERPGEAGREVGRDGVRSSTARRGSSTLRDGKIALAAAPEGEQSAIGAAMTDALDRETSGRVLAMLLLSDGAQRAAAAARSAAASGRAPAGGGEHSAVHVHVRQERAAASGPT